MDQKKTNEKVLKTLYQLREGIRDKKKNTIYLKDIYINEGIDASLEVVDEFIGWVQESLDC